MTTDGSIDDALTAAYVPTAPAPRQRKVDLATVLGLVAAFGVILVAMIAGGAVDDFLHPPSLLVVLGGTAAVTMVSYGVRDAGTVARTVGRTMVRGVIAPRAAARRMLLLADAARRTGLDTLATLRDEIRGEPLLERGVALITEGQPPEEIERTLRAEAETTLADRARAVAILRRAAEVAPAMGLIGTLVGLIQMLGRLDDPAAIGPGMAIALLTTFYGAVLGNMVLHPLAGKVEGTAADDALLASVWMIGSVSIARQENPLRLEHQLNRVLPPAERIRYFGAG